MTKKELCLSQNELVTVKSAIDIVKHIKNQYLGKVPNGTITNVVYNNNNKNDLFCPFIVCEDPEGYKDL